MKSSISYKNWLIRSESFPARKQRRLDSAVYRDRVRMPKTRPAVFQRITLNSTKRFGVKMKPTSLPCKMPCIDR